MNKLEKIAKNKLYLETLISQMFLYENINYKKYIKYMNLARDTQALIIEMEKGE